MSRRRPGPPGRRAGRVLLDQTVAPRRAGVLERGGPGARKAGLQSRCWGGADRSAARGARTGLRRGEGADMGGA